MLTPSPGTYVRFTVSGIPGRPPQGRWGIVRSPHPLMKDLILVDPLFPRLAPGSCWEVWPSVCPLTECGPHDWEVAEVMSS